jgi:hypothetical protein
MKENDGRVLRSDQAHSICTAKQRSKPASGIPRLTWDTVEVLMIEAKDELETVDSTIPARTTSKYLGKLPYLL